MGGVKPTHNLPHPNKSPYHLIGGFYLIIIKKKEMALTKNVTDFIEHVKGHCRRVGIKYEIRPVRYLVLSGNIRCGGYFDDDNKKLVVAGNHKDWLGILVHEYAHLTQWEENCEAWRKGGTGLNNLEHWLSGNKIRSVKDAVNRARNLEYDNELRSGVNQKMEVAC